MLLSLSICQLSWTRRVSSPLATNHPWPWTFRKVCTSPQKPASKMTQSVMSGRSSCISQEAVTTILYSGCELTTQARSWWLELISNGHRTLAKRLSSFMALKSITTAIPLALHRCSPALDWTTSCQIGLASTPGLPMARASSSCKQWTISTVMLWASQLRSNSTAKVLRRKRDLTILASMPPTSSDSNTVAKSFDFQKFEARSTIRHSLSK